MDRSAAIKAFIGTTEFKSAELKPLAGDASFRRYIRVIAPHARAMLMDAPPEKENVRPFIAIAEYLNAHGYSAPKILARDEAQGFLLLEDLGDDSFSRILKAGTLSQEELYSAAIDVLAEWHDANKKMGNPAKLAIPPYDEALLMREAQLFSNWYVPQVLGKDASANAAREYEAIWRDVLRAAPLQTDQFVHRDYHADNLMWLPDRAHTKRVGLLDFQDGVYGDAAYDLVSLLEDARRDVSPEFAEAMLKRYIQKSGCDEARLRAAYAVLAAQRNSKIVGIFLRLAARDGKMNYLSYLPRVWGHLERDLQHPLLAPLKRWNDLYIPKAARGEIKVAHDAKALALSA
jgi:aminoglycoside/choline kinase family phosphotransferase